MRRAGGVLVHFGRQLPQQCGQGVTHRRAINILMFRETSRLTALHILVVVASTSSSSVCTSRILFAAFCGALQYLQYHEIIILSYFCIQLN